MIFSVVPIFCLIFLTYPQKGKSLLHLIFNGTELKLNYCYKNVMSHLKIIGYRRHCCKTKVRDQYY